MRLEFCRETMARARMGIDRMAAQLSADDFGEAGEALVDIAINLVWMQERKPAFPWWGFYGTTAYGARIYCRGCSSFGGWAGETVPDIRHAADCPAVAIDDALAVLAACGDR